MNQELTIRIPLRTSLAIAGLVLLILLLVSLTYILEIFFISILVAVSLSRPVNWLEERGIPRGLGIALIYLLLIAGLVILAFILIPMVIQQVQLLIKQFPNFVREPLRQGSEWLGERIPALRDSLPTGDVAGQIASRAVELISGVGGFALNLGLQVTSLLVALVIILVLAYFLTIQRALASRAVEIFVPTAYQPRLKHLLNIIARRLGRWVWAQATLAGFYALAFGTGLALLKVPYAVTLGVIGGILELIPYVGGFIATILTMTVAFTTSPILAVWVLILHIIIGNIEVHVLAPRLMGRAVETHPVITILALGAGAELLGIVGALIAIPLMVIIQAIIEEFYLAPRGIRITGASAAEQGSAPLLQQSAQPRRPITRRPRSRRRRAPVGSVGSRRHRPAPTTPASDHRSVQDSFAAPPHS